jgi:uncharacterized secreted repeat protein (TIGR03808 family)
MMRRREFIAGAAAAGVCMTFGSSALAADPAYHVLATPTSVTVTASSTSPGPGWTPLTLQGAINAAQTSRTPLNLLPGIYRPSRLLISAPLRLAGIGGVVIVEPSGPDGLNLDITNGAIESAIEDVAVRDIQFRGNSETYAAFSWPANQARPVEHQFAAFPRFGALVSAYNARRLLIENCVISGSGGAGIAIWRSTAQIRDNEISGNAILGIYACDNKETLIEGNRILNSGNGGLLVTRSAQQPASGYDGTIIRGNHFENTKAAFHVSDPRVSGDGYYGNAIWAVWANNLIIEGNSCHNQTFSGIRLFDCHNCAVVGNQVAHSGETAIYCEAPGLPQGSAIPGYEGGAISNNVIRDAGMGISVANAANGGRRVVVSGNSISEIKDIRVLSNIQPYDTSGYGVYAEGDVVVTGNIIEGCDGAGIILLPNRDNLNPAMKLTTMASNNTIKNAAVGIGFVNNPAGYTFIQGNLLQGCATGAIMAGHWGPSPSGGSYYFFPASPPVDYGLLSGGSYVGRPFANVVIGLNFAIGG